MKLLLLAFTLTFSLLSFSGFSAESSSELKQEAQQLLDKNERHKALQILEKAFEVSADPQEIREIAILILSASSKDYSKREAYLKYLIQFAPDHPDNPYWLKEMGDRAFNKGNMDDAEDYYLRAAATHPKPDEVNYQLGYVYLNKDKFIKAFETFFDVYQHESGELKKQSLAEIVKSWWSIGELPSLSFNRILALQSEERNSLLNDFLDATPRKDSAAEKIEAAFLQLRDNDQTRAKLKDFITSGFVIKENPCLLFWNVIEPGDLYPREHLLSCVEQKKRPSAAHLLAYFQQIPAPERNEKLDWVNANLLYENNQAELGLQLMIESKFLTDRSTSYVDTALNRVMALDDPSFQDFERNINHRYLKGLVLLRPKSSLLSRLQSIDPDLWIPFEEESFADELTKDFWIKKTAWLAKKPETSLSQIQAHLQKIFSYPLDRSEKRIQKHLNLLNERLSTSLPEELNAQFEAGYENWTRDLDDSIEVLRSSNPDWQAITRPLLKEALSKNVDEIKTQVRRVRATAEERKERLDFERKKVELRENLDNKYAPVMTASTDKE